MNAKDKVHLEFLKYSLQESSSMEEGIGMSRAYSMTWDAIGPDPYMGMSKLEEWAYKYSQRENNKFTTVTYTWDKHWVKAQLTKDLRTGTWKFKIQTHDGEILAEGDHGKIKKEWLYGDETELDHLVSHLKSDEYSYKGVS